MVRLVFVVLIIGMSVNTLWGSEEGIAKSVDQTATSTGNNKNRPYISPTPGEIPIIASSLCVSGELPTKKEIKEFQQCGFRVLIQDNKEELYDSLFSLLKGTEIKLFASASALRGPSKAKCRNFMNRYRNNPVLGGWEFRDEPRYAELDMLEGIFDVMTKTDPNHLIQINLVGEMAKDFVGANTPDMSAYLDTIQKRFAPGVWSYDYYPLKIVDNNGILIVDYDTFFSDFEAFSQMASKTQRPFWYYCQGVGFRQGRICKPVPKEEYLRFEVFSALAYGAQGIMYWTYRQCRDVPSVDFQYLDGPINLAGKKTKVWNATRNVNNEIKRYNDIFLNAELKEVRHTGKKLYKDTKRLQGSFGPFAALISDDAGVLVSHLTNSGKDYIVIVNHDVQHKQRVSFLVKDNYEIAGVSDKKFSMNGAKSKSIVLSPGGYAIFSFNK